MAIENWVTTFDPLVPVEKVVGMLRGRKTTGQLTIHLSQGEIQKVALTESCLVEDGKTG